MKVSESPYGTTETYVVKFWYENQEGFYRQLEENIYCNSKSAHKQIEAYCYKNLAKFYKNFKIISITYV